MVKGMLRRADALLSMTKMRASTAGTFALFAFPADAVLGVFKDDALVGELVADCVAGFEVFGFAGGGVLGNKLFDLSVTQGGGLRQFQRGGADFFAFSFRPVDYGLDLLAIGVGEDVENGVELLERFEKVRDVILAYGAGIGGCVGVAHHVEDGGHGLRGVQVIVHAGIDAGDCGLGDLYDFVVSALGELRSF